MNLPNISIKQITEATAYKNRLDQELNNVVQCIIDGFEDHPYSVKGYSQESKRYQQLLYITPGLEAGEVWIAKDDDTADVLGVAVWSLPGKLPSDLASLREAHEKFKASLTSEQNEMSLRYSKAFLSTEREKRFPGLWRESQALHLLVTSPKARRKGVASALCRVVMNRIKEEGKGIKMVLLTPTDDARSFYEKQGFKTIWETQTESPNGETVPIYVMMAD